MTAEALDASGLTRARHFGRRLLRSAKYFVGDRPALLPVLVRLTPGGPGRAVGGSTDVVIEGFPRSGNSFAVFAFVHAQERDVEVASHVHHPAQVEVAVRRGLPTILVVREPVATLASYLIYAPHGRPRGVLGEYVRYHRGVSALADRCVVATFDQVTNDFGAVVRRLNERFGTGFDEFVTGPESTRAVFDAIETWHREVEPRRDVERAVPRPSPARSAERIALVAALEAPGLDERLTEAREVYAELAAEAHRDGSGRHEPPRS